MKKFLILIGLVFPLTAFAQVDIKGNVPPIEGYPQLRKNVQQIWDYVLQTYLPGRQVAAPVVTFYSFSRAKQSADWTVWQNEWIRNNPMIWLEWTKISGRAVPSPITKEWVEEHLETLFPFPRTFLAFHYDGTNQIQIDPFSTFLLYYVNNPYGVREDTVGFGYYSLAHEFLHYALQLRGVPPRLHHCIFTIERGSTQTTLMEENARFLIDSRISSHFVMFRGARLDKAWNFCEELVPEDQALARTYLDEL